MLRWPLHSAQAVNIGPMRFPIREEVSSRFPWLFDELQFRIVEDDYSPRMGFSYVVLESDSLRVRFLHERHAIDVQVAPKSDPRRWIKLEFLWDVLTGDRPTPQLDGWAWFLRDHIRELAEALGPQLAATSEAVLRQERENQEALTQYRASLQPTFMGIPRWFYRGPLGWIFAAAILVWTIVK